MDQDGKENRHSAEIIVDGRVLRDDDVIHELVHVIEEDDRVDATLQTAGDTAMRAEIARIAEKVTREMFPAIAERIIREEIEKLKDKQ